MNASAYVIAASSQQQVYPHQLLSAYREYNNIKVLSLDCFDTLLWRRTTTPADVFYELAQTPVFKRHNITASVRSRAEQQIYKRNLVENGFAQATLSEIYRAIKPDLSDDEINELVNVEFELEKNTLYAFQPVMDLMQEAASAGNKIVIVSDIYFTHEQLTALLKYCLPERIFRLIDCIFSSCEYKTGKSEQLFNIVKENLNIQPEQILHVGDNPIADVLTPRKFGINALHFIQYDSILAEMRRLQSVSSNFFNTSQRNRRGSLNYYGGLLAEKLTSYEVHDFIGYAALGPIMHEFAAYISDLSQKIREGGKDPKILFLLRDGYLPSLAFAELAPDIEFSLASISRFASIAVSLRSEHDVIDYLASNIQSGRYENMCKQLLLPADKARKIISRIKSSSQRGKAFNDAIRSKPVMTTILNKAEKYRARFIKYLENELHIQRGDQVIFVDLGYQGTAQIKLSPVLKEMLNVTVTGCYLLSLPGIKATNMHYGLLDYQSCDERAISMLVTYIAVLEQLCTLPSNSVIDYDEAGKPVFADVQINEEQFAKIKPIHRACVQFVKDAQAHLELTKSRPTLAQSIDIAATSLSRLIYLPTAVEINYLESFKHDFNLGTNEVIPLYHIETGLNNLRRRSWLFSLKDSAKTMRMNTPYEFRAANLELSILLMAQHRFGLELAANDLSLRQEMLKVSSFTAEQVDSFNIPATLTHDGYYALLVPVVAGSELGIHFGENYHYVEIESAEMIELAHLYTQKEEEHSCDASQRLTVYEMSDKGGGLFECQSEKGSLIYVPDASRRANDVLRVVFRPIVKRLRNG